MTTWTGPRQANPIARSDRGTAGPDWLPIAAAVGAAVNAGVFYSWSAMVMPAVGRLPTGEGVAAMKVLNSAAPAPFSVVAFGTAALCTALVVRALRARGTSRGRWMISGATLFFLAAIVITFAVNVPISYAIDRLTVADATDGRWGDLRTGWIWANHLRTLGCAASAAVLAAVALRPRPGS